MHAREEVCAMSCYVFVWVLRELSEVRYIKLIYQKLVRFKSISIKFEKIMQYFCLCVQIVKFKRVLLRNRM